MGRDPRGTLTTDGGNGGITARIDAARRRIIVPWLVLAFAVTAACDMIDTRGPGVPAPQRDASAGEPEGEPSLLSQALRRRYAQMQARYLAEGFLRMDDGGPDAAFGAARLAQNFERIALYDEYVVQNGRFVRRDTPSTLRRWEQPVRMGIVHGPSVDAARRAANTDDIALYANRLSRLTGHDIRLVGDRVNFHILIMNVDELRNSPPLLKRLLPGIDSASLREIPNLSANILCAVYAYGGADAPSRYRQALVVIRAEHPDRLRRSCIHEELAQGLGLVNDSPGARPSIFNDDEEFGLLTTHDEMLLKILYDRRLRPGMTPAEARDIVRMIATELTDGTS
ncbi:MAG: DUF2927 domain-containing protein [Pseudomonadota bacterium]